MAAQAAMIADAIAGIKKQINRQGDLSECDEPIIQSTNRRNKLKRKARFVNEGQLDGVNGPRSYKRKIEHAGYERHIINRNPPRLDEDGDELEDEDVDPEADATAAEQNPYFDIKLERILAPLTSAAELPNHLTLSKAYTSTAIPKLVDQSCGMMHKEKTCLWRMRQLLTQFRGDEMWIPCGATETSNDAAVFGPWRAEPRNPRNRGIPTLSKEQSVSRQEQPEQHNSTEAEEHRLGNGLALVGEADLSTDVINDTAKDHPMSNEESTLDDSVKAIDETANSQHKAIEDAPKDNVKEENEQANNGRPGGPGGDATNTLPNAPLPEAVVTNGDAETKHIDGEGDTNMNGTEPALALKDEKGEVIVGASTHDEARPNEDGVRGKQDAQWQEQQDSAPPPAPQAHHMTTRRQAQAATDHGTTPGQTRSGTAMSPSASMLSPPSSNPLSATKRNGVVHPLFLVPTSANPDRDFGLPPAEAEETRRLLMSWVQKQEEVCRGATRLYEGLLKANRMRSTVYKCCKAEGHVGEMSDGEDWYDRDEWGLDGELKKGQDEDEDDINVAGGGGGSGHGNGGGHRAGPGISGVGSIRAGNGGNGASISGAGAGGGGGSSVAASGAGGPTGTGGVTMGAQGKKIRQRRG